MSQAKIRANTIETVRLKNLPQPVPWLLLLILISSTIITFGFIYFSLMVFLHFSLPFPISIKIPCMFVIMIIMISSSIHRTISQPIKVVGPLIISLSISIALTRPLVGSLMIPFSVAIIIPFSIPTLVKIIVPPEIFTIKIWPCTSCQNFINSDNSSTDSLFFL